MSIACTGRGMLSRVPRGLASSQSVNPSYFHSTAKANWVCAKSRNGMQKITLTELRRATRERKQMMAPAAIQFDRLLSLLGNDADDIVRPDIRGAAKEVELGLAAHERGKDKSHALYQLAKYVKRH